MVKTPDDLIKKIRSIQIQTSQIVDEVFAGSYRSAFKGTGIEFEEVREYQSGDDIRTVDWNVSARMGHPYVKVFREERQLTVMLLVDASASSRFGSLYEQKKDLMAEIAGILAFSAIKNNDYIGLIVFTDRIEKYIPPNKGIRHVLRILRELLYPSEESKQHLGTDIKQALSFFQEIRRRSCICFLLSDFLCKDFSRELKRAALIHDMIAIAITDTFEMAIPNLGLIHLKDLETGELKLIDTSSKEVRNNLKISSEERLREQKKVIERTGTSYLEIKTGSDFLLELKRFFKIRKNRRR